jgi:hypothetical protein
MTSAIVSTEKSVQAAVLDYLNTLPYTKAWRQNRGAMLSEYTSKRTGITKKRMVKFGIPGQSDISGICRGWRLDIEIKRAGEVPTKNQAIYLATMTGIGGIALWCDSLRSCVEKLRAEFERRGWAWSQSWNVW